MLFWAGAGIQIAIQIFYWCVLLCLHCVRLRSGLKQIFSIRLAKAIWSGCVSYVLKHTGYYVLCNVRHNRKSCFVHLLCCACELIFWVVMVMIFVVFFRLIFHMFAYMGHGIYFNYGKKLSINNVHANIRKVFINWAIVFLLLR